MLGSPLPFAVLATCLAIYLAWRSLFSAEAVAARNQKKILREWRELGVSSIYNGHDFEHYIADTLRRHGVKATVTPGSGDQGVDIVAVTRRGTRIAIQAKLYTSNVNNKAVQEVFAGMRFHNCSVGFVITNSMFTKSAIELATATGIKLIGFMEMKGFETGKHWIYSS